MTSSIVQYVDSTQTVTNIIITGLRRPMKKSAILQYQTLINYNVNKDLERFFWDCILYLPAVTVPTRALTPPTKPR